MNSLLLWLGGFLVAVFALLFGGPYLVDWNSYRGVFEEEATRVLGRKVRVGGAVNLRLLPVPYVRFEKVKIADDTGTLGAPFFSADGFTLWLSAPPLLRGVLEAKQVELERPVLNLAVNKAGSGNWRSFKIASGSLPFVPNEVALQSMKISNGRMSLRLGGDKETIVLSGLDGELSADGLSGPYRFRGDVDFETARHEIRLSTEAPEADGSVRIKVVVRGAADGGSYVVDGRAADLMGAATFNGVVSAKIPIANIQGRVPVGPVPVPAVELSRASDSAVAERKTVGAVSSAEKAPGAVVSKRRQRNGFDLKAKLAVNSLGFKLADILMSFDSDGRPQLITGLANGAWDKSPKLDVALSARWLDIDRIAGGRDGVSPALTAGVLGQRIFELVLRDWDAEARLSVDQANLGKDVVGDLVVDLARKAGRELTLRQLSVALPGGVRFRTSGQLSGEGAKQAYSGRMTLHGGSVARFLTWATQGGFVVSARADQPFSLNGKVAILNDTFALSEATAEFGGRLMRGGVSRSWGSRKFVSLAVQGDDIDIAPFAPGLLAVLSERPLDFAAPVKRGLVGKVHGEGDGKQKTFNGGWLSAYDGNFRLDLRAKRLSDGGTVLNDVDARVARSSGTLTLRRLAWKTPAGLSVDAKGQISDFRTSPQGGLSGWVRASRAEALKSVVTFVGEDSVVAPFLDPVLSGAPSFSVGFSSRFGGVGREEGFETILDGVVGASPVRGMLRLAGGLKAWRKGEVETRVNIKSASLSEVLRTLGHKAGESVGAQRVVSGAITGREKVGGAHLALYARGRSADQLAVIAGLESPELAGHFDGRGAIARQGGLLLRGRLSLKSQDVRSVLPVILAGWKPDLQKTSINGVALVVVKDRAITLEPQAMTLGGTRVSGKLRLATKGADRDRRYTAEGRLDLSTVSIDHALGLIVAGGSLPQPGGHWSEGAFKLALLDRVEGDVLVGAQQVFLGDSVVLGPAQGRLRLGPKRLGLEDIKGKFFGGAFSGALNISARAAGVRVDTRGKLDGVDLGKLTALGQQQFAARGTGSVRFDLSGDGFTPRSVAANLHGKGYIAGTGVTIFGLSTDAVHRAAGAVIAKGRDTEETTAELLGRELKKALSGSELAVGTRRIPLQVADGTIRLEPFSVAGPKGSIGNMTTVDLVGLKIDSEWKLKANSDPAWRAGDGNSVAGLPPLSVVYVGPLSALMAIDRRIVTDALDRELTVLRMEQSVERLEQLRRVDEERAKQEAKRIKTLDDERRRALAVPGVPLGNRSQLGVAPKVGLEEMRTKVRRRRTYRPRIGKKRFDPWVELESRE